MSSYILADRNDLDFVDRKLLELTLECADAAFQRKLLQLREEYHQRLIETNKNKMDNFKKVMRASGREEKDYQEVYNKILKG